MDRKKVKEKEKGSQAEGKETIAQSNGDPKSNDMYHARVLGKAHIAPCILDPSLREVVRPIVIGKMRTLASYFEKGVRIPMSETEPIAFHLVSVGNVLYAFVPIKWIGGLVDVVNNSALLERTNKAKGKDKEVAEKGSAGKRKGAFDDNKIGGGRKRNNFDVETLQVPGLLKIRHIGQTTLRSAAYATNAAVMYLHYKKIYVEIVSASNNQRQHPSPSTFAIASLVILNNSSTNSFASTPLSQICASNSEICRRGYNVGWKFHSVKMQSNNDKKDTFVYLNHMLAAKLARNIVVKMRDPKIEPNLRHHHCEECGK
ncbi:hypothetical protein JHK87_031362 [Glycine soja]|nr:hypothetical protein JHK87_031362 [Glycine soja]